MLILVIGPLDAASLSEVTSTFDASRDGEPCEHGSRGLIAFLDRQRLSLNGNGRDCTDCQMPVDGFKHSSGNAKASLQRLLRVRRLHPHEDDPRLHSIDTDDWNTLETDGLRGISHAPNKLPQQPCRSARTRSS